jgi:hypothetical protein
MYHPEKVAARLAVATAHLGWKPVYHTIEEVDRINKRFEGIAERDEVGKPTGKTTRPYTEEEKWWIRNERILCVCDASYFLTRYACIKAENHIFRFKFRAAQRVYYNVISELERRGAAIQIICLKGRQVGISTLTELLVTHRICFYYGVNAVIASSAQQPTRLMSQMMFVCYDNIPYWLKPTEKTRSESERGELTFTNQSGCSFQHGSQTTGIARGHTPTCVHLSECASFTNAEELIDASLFRAVHESPEIFMVLESTAEGNFGWWYEKWQSSKTGWPKGRSRLCPVFLPWYIATEMYPKPTWLLTRPIPQDWQPSKETRVRMAKAKAFVASSPELSKVMGTDWEMPREQAWYSEVDFEEYKANGREKLWKQEMAGDDVECFQGGYDSVFGNDLLSEIRDNRKQNYDVYGLSGHGIEDNFEPDEEDMDFDLPRKVVKYSSNRGGDFTWEMIPLRRNLIEDGEEDEPEKAETQADGKLLVFQHPEEGYDYSIGVDTGGGVGGDSTAISVWRKGVRGMPDVQAAEFASAYVSHVDSYAFIMVIAAYYAKFMKEGHPREPLVSIEQIAAVGDVCQPQMRKMGYSRFHHFVRYDTKKIEKKKSNKMGWFTSGWSRPILIDTFVHNVKNGWLTIHSPFLLREMKRFEVHNKAGKEKLEHADGDHDDRIFSSAIAVFTSHDTDAMVERGKHRPVPVGVKYRPPISLEPSGWTVPTKTGALESMMVNVKTTTELEDYLANERLSY